MTREKDTHLIHFALKELCIEKMVEKHKNKSDLIIIASMPYAMKINLK